MGIMEDDRNPFTLLAAQTRGAPGPEVERQVEEMAACGLTAGDILRVLGWGASELALYSGYLVVLNDALKRGRAKAKLALGRQVFMLAAKGDLRAIRLYMAVHAGWSVRNPLPAELFELDDKALTREGIAAGSKDGEIAPELLKQWNEILEADLHERREPARGG